MRSLRLLPCVLALACSEYDLKSQVDPAGGAPSPDSPPAAPPGGDDTGDTAPKGSRDCQLADDIQLRELTPSPSFGHYKVGDFDGSGRLMMSIMDKGLYAVDYGGDAELLVPWPNAGSGPEPVGWQHGFPTTLADGNLAGWSHRTMGILEPASGMLVASVPLPDAEYPNSVRITASAADGENKVLWAEHTVSLPQNRASIVRMDPYSGFRKVIAEHHLLGSTGLDITPVSGNIYFNHPITIAFDDIYTLERLGPWEWGPPVWAGRVNDRIEALAVDWCDNVYLLGITHLWVLAPGSQEAQPLVPIPPGIWPFNLIWGNGEGGTSSKALYFSGNDPDFISLVRRFEVDLDVDGTHVLAR